MNMKRLIAILYLPFCTLFLQAQEALTLKECRDLALQHNKEMAAAVKQTESARYTAKSYWGNFFPNITASGTGLYTNIDGRYSIPGGNLPTFQLDAASGQPLPTGGFAYFPGIDLNLNVDWAFMAGIHVEQPIYMGGKISAAYRMAKLGSQMARMNETLTATEVILKTDQAYVMVIKAKEMKVVADKYHAVLSELKKNVDSAYKHGLKPQNDVLKVQVKLNESELNIRKADNALRLAQMNLCHLIGRPLTEHIEVSTDFPTVEADMQMQVHDISARPEYGILEKKVGIARQQVKLSRSELLPQVGIRGSYSYLNGVELNNEKLFDDGTYSVLLNVSIPIFHFGERTNKVRAAKAKLAQTRLEQQNLNEQMLLELTRAANNLDEARLESELSDRSLAQAEENMRISKSQFDVGLETLSDHLESQALWQKAYEAKVDAHFQLYLSYVEYLKTSGRLIDK